MMKDRWKEKTIGQIKEETEKTIMTVSGIYHVSDGYRQMLIKDHDEVFDQLQKAVTVGKIFQNMLKEFMSPGMIAIRLREEMLKADASGVRGLGNNEKEPGREKAGSSGERKKE